MVSIAVAQAVIMLFICVWGGGGLTVHGTFYNIINVTFLSKNLSEKILLTTNF